MKLRISGNSLRLRLTRSDVEEFASNGSCENSIDLAGGKLVYRLVRSDGPSLAAGFDGSRIAVQVPAVAADRWTGGDDVAIEAPVDGGVRIVIEKDFACLKPRADEDTDDHYPHPATGAAC